MATQNFVAGGFYGKLGGLVGQRWRNKRTLRQYVIGENPRTVPQQANRALFGAAVALAQQALNINRNAPAWADLAVGEFSLRVGTAKSRLQLGLTQAQSVPLFPDGYVPEHTFAAADLVTPALLDTLNYLLTAAPPVGSRRFVAGMYLRHLLTGAWGIQYKDAELPAAGDCIFSPELSSVYGSPPGGWIEGATLHDDEFSDQAYFLPRLAVSEAASPLRTCALVFDHATWYADHVDVFFTSTQEPFEEPPIIQLEAYMWYEYQMAFIPIYDVWESYPVFIGGNEWLLSIGRDPPDADFPAGSYIVAKNVQNVRSYYTRRFEIPQTFLTAP